MTLTDVLVDFAQLSVLMIVAAWLRRKIYALQRFYIPAALLAGILAVIAVLWVFAYNTLLLSALHPALADSRGIRVFWQEAILNAAIAVVVTVSMTWVGLLVINSLLVLPAAAARNVARNMRQYHLASLLGALLSGLAGLMTSYYIGSSAGASITLYLAVWFAVTFLLRKKCI